MRRAVVMALHVLGAALGGAVIGCTFGWIGNLLSLPRWQPWLILIGAVFALWLGLDRRFGELGMRRQVPRSWARKFSPSLRFFLWGVLLGSAITIAIPFSALVFLLLAESTSGVAISAMCGGLFGATRGLMACVLLFDSQSRQYPERLPMRLLMLMARGRSMNVLWIISAAILLTITVGH